MRQWRWKQRSPVGFQQRSPGNDSGRNPGRNARRSEARHLESSHQTILRIGVGRLRHQGQRLSLFSAVLLQSGGGAAVRLGQRRDRHALIVDAFADPIVGQISDNLRTRWGRRHPLMYAAAIPVAIGYYLLWNPPHWSNDQLFYYLIGIIVLVRTFITTYEIPSTALIAELTPDYDQRTSFLSYRYLFGWLGGLTMALLAFGVFFSVTKQYPVGQLNPEGYFKYSVTACVLMVAAIWISDR